MTHRVSTVIRCADLAYQLYSTLRSVERQTGGPGEVVLVADRSTSDSIKPWLAGLADTRGYAFVDAPHAHPGAVRNAGIGATVTPYVMCLDAGDRLDRLCHQAFRAALDANDDIHLVTSQVLMLGPGSERRVVPDEPGQLDQLVGDSMLAHSASLFRRDSWVLLDGFDEALPCLDDYELFLRMLDNGRRGIFIDRPLLVREWRADALYHRFWGSEERAEAFRTIIERHAARFSEDPVAALYPRERHLHETAGRYRRLVARHEETQQEIERLGTKIDTSRGRLSEEGRDAVTFADLRRTSPVARDWGYERGVPVDRHYIERFIEQHASDIRGTVLEVQEPDYTTRFGGERVTRSEVVDLNAANPRATVLSDMRCATNLASDTYDCLIITQTLHVIDDMPAVVSECARVLKPGGVLLATLPCTSRVCLEYGYGGDLWRVTVDGARQLFADRFPLVTLEVEGRGNTLVGTAFLYGLACHELQDTEFDVDDPYNPMLVTVRAVKDGGDAATTHPRTGAGSESRHAPFGAKSRPATVGDSRRTAAAILLYHGVGLGRRDVDPHRLGVVADDFRSQMAHVRDHYVVLPLADLADAVRTGSAPPNTVAVTLDDGYLDNHTVASPILSELGVPATFFVTTEHLRVGRRGRPDRPGRPRRPHDNDYEFWWDALSDYLLGPHPDRPDELRLDLPGGGRRFTTRTDPERRQTHDDLYHVLNGVSVEQKDQVMEALQRWCGRIEPTDPTRRRMNSAEVTQLARRPGHAVGAHTVRHLMLPSQPADVQRAEMAESKATLEALVDADVSAFAYPFGAFDDAVIENVRTTGFRAAVTCEEAAVTDRLNTLQLPRFEVPPDLPEPFDNWLENRVRG